MQKSSLLKFIKSLQFKLIAIVVFVFIGGIVISCLHRLPERIAAAHLIGNRKEDGVGIAVDLAAADIFLKIIENNVFAKQLRGLFHIASDGAFRNQRGAKEQQKEKDECPCENTCLAQYDFYPISHNNTKACQRGPAPLALPS